MVVVKAQGAQDGTRAWEVDRETPPGTDQRPTSLLFSKSQRPARSR